MLNRPMGNLRHGLMFRGVGTQVLPALNSSRADPEGACGIIWFCCFITGSSVLSVRDGGNGAPPAFSDQLGQIISN